MGTLARFLEIAKFVFVASLLLCFCWFTTHAVVIAAYGHAYEQADVRAFPVVMLCVGLIYFVNHEKDRGVRVSLQRLFSAAGAAALLVSIVGFSEREGGNFQWVDETIVLSAPFLFMPLMLLFYRSLSTLFSQKTPQPMYPRKKARGARNNVIRVAIVICALVLSFTNMFMIFPGITTVAVMWVFRRRYLRWRRSVVLIYMLLIAPLGRVFGWGGYLFLMNSNANPWDLDSSHAQLLLNAGYTFLLIPMLFYVRRYARQKYFFGFSFFSIEDRRHVPSDSLVAALSRNRVASSKEDFLGRILTQHGNELKTWLFKVVERELDGEQTKTILDSLLSRFHEANQKSARSLNDTFLQLTEGFESIRYSFGRGRH